jgi:putative hydrolase of the HAD superfamily
MRIRAAILDVYCTLLEVGPPPADAERRWEILFHDFLNMRPKFSRVEFAVRCDRVIARQHAEARARGIQWPEIQWPSVVLEVIPELARLRPARREDFLFEQMQVGRTIRLSRGAAATLSWMREHQVLLGLASNAQSYTLREMEAALSGKGLTRSIFEPQLCFWSFEHGFAKPDPHVFRMLSARLEQRGIRPGEALMVGDRLDNDLRPAQAFGWQCWEFGARPQTQPGGTWQELGEWIKERTSAA